MIQTSSSGAFPALPLPPKEPDGEGPVFHEVTGPSTTAALGASGGFRSPGARELPTGYARTPSCLGEGSTPRTCHT
jgi:hypothetical protein